ncbi:N-succinylarginine dihydrolase [Sphingomonas sp.]|uniref:N-succinylarginine dihydrolase n=1 Tax=Sphingomonas sp. TaxID=28214 RepID=UPI002DEDB45E|nr:N-succinylarginine dihydrolase [Sphingomonas sp.]
MLQEINFDGIVGPSHNYGGLSLGNLASAKNANHTSYPRAAALQGLDKMRHNLRLGLAQGILLPHPRPDWPWLESLGASMESSPPLPAWAMSASPMWTANAATVSPAPDTKDGKCHLTVANLVTMPHRSHEWPNTLKQLRLAFGGPSFAVHGPVPAPFGDEGAANHMRLAPSHGEPGVEIFVYGRSGGRFPARQHRMAGEAVAAHHGLDPARTLLVEQAEEAIAAGAFHNDVVAVADCLTLFAHEQAFADRASFYSELERLVPEVRIVEVPASRVSLEDAIASYLFNAQLVTLPSGEQALIVPSEAHAVPSVRDYLEELVAGNGPIRATHFVDVRQSMANGGGPACLRLRVVADPAEVDQRFMIDEAKLDRVGEVIAETWPETIESAHLADPELHKRIAQARAALLETLELGREDL